MVKSEKKKKKKKSKDARSVVASITAVTAVFFPFARCFPFPGYSQEGLEAMKRRSTGKESLPSQVLGTFIGTYRYISETAKWPLELKRVSVAYSGHYLARPSATSRVFTLEYPIFEDPTFDLRNPCNSYFLMIFFVGRERALTDCSCVKSGGCGLFRNMGDEIT